MNSLTCEIILAACIITFPVVCFLFLSPLPLIFAVMEEPVNLAVTALSSTVLKACHSKIGPGKLCPPGLKFSVLPDYFSQKKRSPTEKMCPSTLWTKLVSWISLVLLLLPVVHRKR